MRRDPSRSEILLVNLSGRGDKDIFTVDGYLREQQASQEPGGPRP